MVKSKKEVIPKMLNSLNKYNIVKGKPNILIGCSGNGLSTQIRKEVTSKAKTVAYIDCFSLSEASTISIIEGLNNYLKQQVHKDFVVIDHVQQLINIDNSHLYRFYEELTHLPNSTVILVFDEFVDILNLKKPALSQIFF